MFRSIKAKLWSVGICAAVIAALASMGLSSAGAAAALDDGVTAKGIDIGYIFSKTGVAGSTFLNADKGCQARVDRENAAGGVNGRKINVEMVDDQSSGANKTAAQDLVQNKHVFMVVNNSSFAFLTYKFLKDAGIPQVNGGYDGTYYGEPGNENVISASGNVVSANGVVYDNLPKLMKKMGATKVAALAYGISASSTAAAENFQKFAVPAVPGLKAVYTNTTVDFGSTDVSPIVLGIKNSGADAAFYAMNANTNLAIAQGLVQNGVKMKAEMMATGYGQALLDEPSVAQIGSDVLFTQGWAPVEAKTKATKLLQADLKKYADFTGVPDFGIYTGYVDCDLMITGLKQQGQNLDQSTYADGLRALGKVNPAGLGCQPIDISAETYGKPAPTICSWALFVKDDKFVVLSPKGGGDPFWTGKLISASVSAPTTTTAAPAS